MFDATLAELRGLVPGLRLERNRLRAKIETTAEGPQQRFLEEEFDEVVCLLKGILSLTGEPRPRRLGRRDR